MKKIRKRFIQNKNIKLPCSDWIADSNTIGFIKI